MGDGEVILASPSVFRLVLPGPRRGGFLQQRVEQLVRDAITDGVLVEGDRLPPYRALIVDGVVRSVPGDGYFIAGTVRYRDFFTPPGEPCPASASAGEPRA